MPRFRIKRLPADHSSVQSLAAALKRFELEPSYQRQSEVWGEEKQQLFIDSLLNGFDVPKLYFHQLKQLPAPAPLFAIVDGKQRLEAIRQFVSDGFALSEEFVDEEVADGQAAGQASGKTFEQLTNQHPALAGRLMSRILHVEVIETDDIEVIEEMFSRLNEAVPLNAPEKRNAFGGAMPPIIRRFVQSHSFFRECLPIENTRYRQYDLVTKFLFLTGKGELAATKKRALDEFVRFYRYDKKDENDKNNKKRMAARLAERTTEVLDLMAATFKAQDQLLTSVGLVTVYYMAFLRFDSIAFLESDRGHAQVHARLVEFDQLRRQNRLMLRREQAAIASGKTPTQGVSIRRDLAIFDRLMQSPNDGQALEYRFKILKAFLEGEKFDDELPAGLSKRVGPE